jgi:hypothetical protein
MPDMGDDFHLLSLLFAAQFYLSKNKMVSSEVEGPLRDHLFWFAGTGPHTPSLGEFRVMLFRYLPEIRTNTLLL